VDIISAQLAASTFSAASPLLVLLLLLLAFTAFPGFPPLLATSKLSRPVQPT
jgi:hypothetical protein